MGLGHRRRPGAVVLHARHEPHPCALHTRTGVVGSPRREVAPFGTLTLFCVRALKRVDPPCARQSRVVVLVVVFGLALRKAASAWCMAVLERTGGRRRPPSLALEQSRFRKLLGVAELSVQVGAGRCQALGRQMCPRVRAVMHLEFAVLCLQPEVSRKGMPSGALVYKTVSSSNLVGGAGHFGGQAQEGEGTHDWQRRHARRQRRPRTRGALVIGKKTEMNENALTTVTETALLLFDEQRRHVRHHSQQLSGTGSS